VLARLGLRFVRPPEAVQEIPMHVNPYKTPNFHTRNVWSRGRYEWAVVLGATVLIAALWTSAGFYGERFFVAVGLSTIAIAIAIGTVGYALAARRTVVLLALLPYAGAVITQEISLNFLFLLGFLAAPAAFLVSLVRPTRGHGTVLVQTVMLVGFSAGAVFLYSQLRSLGAWRATERGNRIVEAIDRYRARESKLPASLEDLVPRDLESIPDTGMAAYPWFQYLVASEANSLVASYELRVDVYKFLQFDVLVDWPERNYPDVMYGGGVERMGDWAYVHE
jgi:hypothetical protein